jgi:hypothetical protein
MKSPFRKRWLLLSALVIPLALPSLEAQEQQAVAPAQEAAVLKEGSDCWQTEPGTQQRLRTLPANFFGQGSKAVPNPTIKFKGVPLPPARVKDPFPKGCGCPEKVDTKITWLDPHGNVTRDMRHAVKQVVDQTTKVDTCVHRKTNANFKGRGVAQKVDIQLVALSLQSIEPLKVTYTNGSTKLFDVFVTESGPQDTGTMTFTPTSFNARRAKGNVKLGALHITYDVKFVEHGGTATFSVTGQRLQLVNTPGTFEQLVP